MQTIGEGFIEALKLLIGLDKETYEIICLSVVISLTSTTLSAAIGIPLGIVAGVKTFRFKRQFARLLYTCMSLPPVVIGLIVAILLSRSGPLGKWQLIFTPAAMVIAQMLLITPIIAGILFNGAKQRGRQIRDYGKTMGAGRMEILLLLISEMRTTLLVAVVSGFGRAISEVGAVMIVGGNIKHHTRVMTTYIAMNNSMGNYASAIAMGVVLLLISFSVNAFLYRFVEGDNDASQD